MGVFGPCLHTFDGSAHLPVDTRAQWHVRTCWHMHSTWTDCLFTKCDLSDICIAYIVVGQLGIFFYLNNTDIVHQYSMFVN